ncbi:MAG: glycosyltransferase family 2 protein [Gammaproteobacteria bacterium]|nr:glycosyltransferase family 2 protein [Gammaproteobacteria bacterium]
MKTFSPCFVIPNYNHSIIFEQLVDSLNEYQIPIIIVNDGSNNETTTLLNSLDSNYSHIEVIHLNENRGKGKAVMTGMLYAQKQGYSHALQVDADGQHNLEDIQLFLEASQKSPDSVICGCPIYDDSVPTGRLISRYITHFWVWIETLSFKIKDSMCGFRLYPLHSTSKIINTGKVGHRMDFDTSILVRLYWANVGIEFLPSKVIYPEDGVSHFRMLKDNWLITKMHTRLFFGMLIRLPSLLKRKLSSKNITNKTTHWAAKKEKGSFLGLRFMVASYKLFGRGTFLLLLYPVIAYFALTSRTARLASQQYLQQFAQFNGNDNKISWKDIYAHFYEFGVSAIDKISSWLGDINENDIIMHHPELLEEIAKSGKGAIFIGSHLGNLELSRAIAESNKNIKINAVIFNKHALKFHTVLNESNPNVELNLIHVENVSADTSILLKQKVEQGEIVIIVGDRTSVSNAGRVHYVSFLGKKAPFAEGPFILAGILECPVYLLLCLKQESIYNIYLEHFADSMKFPRKIRKQQLATHIQQFADRLTYYCQKAPLQWFNFFDFWQSDTDSDIQRKQYHEIERK